MFLCFYGSSLVVNNTWFLRLSLKHFCLDSRKYGNEEPNREPMRPLRITHNIAQRDSEVDKYMNEIAKNDLLSAEEEGDLARKIRNGDSDALETLVKSNLRFVVSVAKQYQN